MSPACQIEFECGIFGNTVRCGKPIVAMCGDCGMLICADCRTECCHESFCDACYYYHREHSCLRKAVQAREAQPALRDDKNAA